jgi:hypothetical protein
MSEESPVESRISKYGWIYQGLLWATFMILFTGVGEPLYNGDPITFETLFHKTLLWIPAGLLFGLVTRYFARRKEKKENNS